MQLPLDLVGFVLLGAGCLALLATFIFCIVGGGRA